MNNHADRQDIAEVLNRYATGIDRCDWPRPPRYFDEDLVVYRDESGDLHGMEAHCKHLGAHLGHGGTVATSSAGFTGGGGAPTAATNTSPTNPTGPTAP